MKLRDVSNTNSFDKKYFEDLVSNEGLKMFEFVMQIQSMGAQISTDSNGNTIICLNDKNTSIINTINSEIKSIQRAKWFSKVLLDFYESRMLYYLNPRTLDNFNQSKYSDINEIIRTDNTLLYLFNIVPDEVADFRDLRILREKFQQNEYKFNIEKRLVKDINSIYKLPKELVNKLTVEFMPKMSIRTLDSQKYNDENMHQLLCCDMYIKRFCEGEKAYLESMDRFLYDYAEKKMYIPIYELALYNVDKLIYRLMDLNIELNKRAISTALKKLTK